MVLPNPRSFCFLPLSGAGRPGPQAPGCAPVPSHSQGQMVPTGPGPDSQLRCGWVPMCPDEAQGSCSCRGGGGRDTKHFPSSMRARKQWCLGGGQKEESGKAS